MAALAASTSRVRLGQMCTCMGYRNPALLAKIAATVDLISGGRLEFGIGAGWYEHEWRAYGYGFPGVGDRISALRDGVQIIQRLWAEGEATLESQTFSVDGAICRPQPLQRGRDGRPRIPTWIAGGGEQRTLRYAAKWADATNFGGSPEQFARKRDVLLGHLDKEGRDPAEVRLTSNLNVVVRETEAEARRVVDEVNARADSAMPAEHAGTGFSTRGAVVGTPQQVRSVIDGVREHDIPVVFCESTVNTSPAKQVARETGARYGGDLYVDSLSEADGKVPTYLDLLKVTSSTVVEGLKSNSQ